MINFFKKKTTPINEDTFCAQPWIGIHAWPDGSVFPCCMYDSHKPLGNINNENIEDLVNNDNYKKLREELINGQKPEGCNRCYQLEEAGIQTLRKSTNSSFSHHITPIIESKKLTMSEVRYLDIRFSNICNFKCRTCGPELSSKWGPEIPLLKNQPDPGIIQIPRDKFWQYYEQALETAEEIVFAGGEALMQEEHYAALFKLIELKKFDVKIMYTTNLSTLKYKQIDLFDLWSKFKNIEIYASLDASGERAEYIRKGTVWSNIVENRKKIKKLEGVKFFITPTISLFNVWHFPDFYKDWVENDLLEPTNIRLNILTHPPRQQANVLENKELIINRWQDLIDWVNERVKDSTGITSQFESVINFLRTEPESKYKLLEKFSYVNDSVDNIRNEKIYEIFPELKQHLRIPSMNSKTFCVFPFFNLNSNTDGSVKLCCNIRDNSHIKKSDQTDFNLGTDNIEDIWNNSHLSDVRLKMLMGEEVRECKDCYRHEQLTGSSSRIESNRKYISERKVVNSVNEFLLKNEVPLSNLTSLELRLGNTCNLSCNSCWGYSSSKVNEERVNILSREPTDSKLHSLWNSELHIPQEINKWFKNDAYKNNINRTAGNLGRIYLTGGEPTLIKENRNLLHELINTGNTNCFVSFTTNGTVADSELLELIKQFPNNEIQISIDGIEDQANYIRYPVNWIEFQTNVKNILNLSNVKIVFYTVISAYNLYSISDILKYINEIARYRYVSWYPIFLDNPDYMRTQVWSMDIRIKAVDEIKNTVKSLEFLKMFVSEDVFQRLYDYYTSVDSGTGNIKEFLKFNSILDNHRGTNFSNTFPELSCLI